MKQRAEILKDMALIGRKVWRFKKQKNKPIQLLKRLHDSDIKQLEKDIETYNLTIDLETAQRDALALLAYIESFQSRPRAIFRRSYAYETFLENLSSRNGRVKRARGPLLLALTA